MDLNQIKQQVIELSLECGSFIRKERETFNWSKVESKGTNDLVSYVDKEAEKQMVARLSQLLPEAGFITEEGTASANGEELLWIIDPLDGTTNFIHNLPCYSTSIALASGKELILGVVFDIGQNDCYHAHKGGGAFMNDQPISVSPNTDLSNGLVATGFPYYNFEKLGDYMNILTDLMQHCHGLRRWGSAAIDLAYVASGRFDAFFEYNLNPYDVAAGAHILQEAGGIVTDFSGGDNYLFGREIIAANTCHQQIFDVIHKHW